jgi:hypothetical protein
MYGEKGRCILDFGGKRERKRPLDKFRRRWMDNIKMYVKERGWKIVHWICLGQNRYKLGAVVGVELQHSGSVKCGKFLD